MSSGSITGLLTQIGAGFGAQSVLLKYSRDAERQANLVGTQILYDNSYDPRAMAQFFEKLLPDSKGNPPQFFSSHPNPENRITAVNAEIKKMGGDLKNYQNDSSGQIDLDAATDQLIASLRKSNSEIWLTKKRSRIRVSGLPALSMMFSNASPAGGKETDWLVTSLRPEGLVFFVFVAPEQEFASYQKVFQDMINSIQFSRR